MKAQLTFNLPDDQIDFDLAVNAGNWFSVCWDLDQWLRSQLKYNEEISECDAECYEQLRERLREFMFNHGLTFK